MDGLSSYALKDIVMLMIRDKKLVWRETNLPELFLGVKKLL
jgi:hypothetical protein